MRDPIDPEVVLGNNDESDIRVVLAWLESKEMTWAFRGDLKIRRRAPHTPVRSDGGPNLQRELCATARC